MKTEIILSSIGFKHDLYCIAKDAIRNHVQDDGREIDLTVMDMDFSIGFLYDSIMYPEHPFVNRCTTKICYESLVNVITGMDIDMEVESDYLIVPTTSKELEFLIGFRTWLIIEKVEGIKFCMGSDHFIEMMMDKRRCYEYFTAKGVPNMGEKEVDLDQHWDDIDLPFFKKPVNESGSRGVQLVYDKCHLDEEQDMVLRSNIYQEYMPPNEYDEITVDAYYSEGFLMAMIPRRRVVTKHGASMMAEVDSYHPVWDHMMKHVNFLPGCSVHISLVIPIKLTP